MRIVECQRADEKNGVVSITRHVCEFLQKLGPDVSKTWSKTLEASPVIRHLDWPLHQHCDVDADLAGGSQELKDMSASIALPKSWICCLVASYERALNDLAWQTGFLNSRYSRGSFCRVDQEQGMGRSSPARPSA